MSPQFFRSSKSLSEGQFIISKVLSNFRANFILSLNGISELSSFTLLYQTSTAFFLLQIAETTHFVMNICSMNQDRISKKE